LVSANITPDKATGIGNWTAEGFVELFKSYRDTSKTGGKPQAHTLSPMPWYDYSGMTKTDLKAIFAYLQTLKPVHNKVIND